MSFRLPFQTALAVGLLALAAGCGGEPTPKPKTADTQVDAAAEKEKIGKGRRKIDDANRAYNSKNYDKARKLLREAADLGVESQRFEIDEALEKIDKRQAKLFANEAAEKLEQKDCAGAFKDLAEPMEDLKSDTFTREIRRLLEKSALKCMQAAIDEKTMSGDYAAARALIDAPATKAVIGPQAHKKLTTELDATITEALKGKVAEDVKARKWSEAMGKLDAAIKKGDANEAQQVEILEVIRQGAAPEISAQCTRAVGGRDAPAVLKSVDALIKLLRWEIMGADVAALAKDKALPEDLTKKRTALAVWVEGQRVGLKPLRRSEKRWTHGKLPLVLATKSDGESKRDLPGNTEVYLLGSTKEKALIAEAPADGSLAAMLGSAVGWVPLDRLAKESTANWLPPDDQLKDVRVWGPLRSPEPLLELGTVVEIAGKDVTVKRLTDDKTVKVPKKSLRSAPLSAGTKVVAVCKTKEEQGVIEELLTAGRPVPIVKLKCPNADAREEYLPALRTKPELLPSTKQPL